jgi:hypothetical protein
MLQIVFQLKEEQGGKAERLAKAEGAESRRDIYYAKWCLA